MSARTLARLWLAALVAVVVACGGSSEHDPDTGTATAALSAPQWPAGASLQVLSASGTSATLLWPAATHNGLDPVYEVTRDGVIDTSGTPAPHNLGWSFTATGLVACRPYRFRVELKYVAADGSTQTTGKFLETIVVPAAGIPPSATPSANELVATDFYETTRWLYEPSGALQSGFSVTVDDVWKQSVGAVRGHVRTRAGSPIGCVAVSVVGHPEYGQTPTLADGTFTLAVHGEATLTLKYVAPSWASGDPLFLPGYRVVTTRRHQYVWADEARLTPPDPVATKTTIAGAGALYAGPTVTDDDGARQARIFVPSGTTATVPGGPSLTSFDVRLTEYTYGRREVGGLTEITPGVVGMPAPLPPATAYTYAVELGVVGHEGAHVTFDQDVPFYVDNFMGFPTSTSSSPSPTDTEIPVGWWREESGAWVPEPNGKVIEITGHDGSTPPRAIVAPSGLVTSDAERIALATFTVGKKLWRATTRHFSMIDLNMGWGLSATAKRPDKPNGAEESVDDPNCASGSVIECENRTLGEHIAVPGTGLTLTYNSARHPGHTRIVRVPVTEPEHEDYKGHEVRVTAGGKVLKSILALKDPANPRRYIHRFVWDGRDYLDRPVLGDAEAHVSIGFSYRAEWLTSPSGFGGGCSGTCAAVSCTLCAGDSERMTIKLWSEQTLRLASWDDQASGLGGWTIDAHHWLDPITRTIFRGDGGVQRGPILEPIVDTMWPPADDGHGFDVAPDGTIYSNGFYGRLTKARNGVVQIRPTWGRFVRLAPDGTLYEAESAVNNENKLFRYPRASDGTVDIFASPEVVAGSGVGVCSSPITDGMPATSADLCNIWDLAIGADGSVFLAGSRGVFRVEPPGASVRRIFRVGSLEADSRAVAVGPDGSVYARVVRNVYRVDPSGAQTLVLAGMEAGVFVEGVAALAADGVDPIHLGVSSDGILYVSTTANRIVRVVDGRVYSVAGRDGIAGTNCATTEYGGAASDAHLSGPARLVPKPDGTLYFMDSCGRIRRIRSTFGGLSQYTLATTDGSQLLTFDTKGRHLRTTNALTNVVETSFEYSDDGRYPTAVIDAYGNRTTIERPTSTDRSRPTKITGPFGQETVLETQPNASASHWLLWRVTAPNGDRIALRYDTSGELLTGMWTPSANLPSWEQYGKEHVYTYDALGKLVQDSNPVGGFKHLAPSTDHDTWRVAVQTALGRKAVHSVRPMNDGLGSMIRESWGPTGSKSTTIQSKTPWTGGSTTETHAADGSSSKVVEVGDKRLPGSKWVQSTEAHVPFPSQSTPCGGTGETGTCPSGFACEGRVVEVVAADGGVTTVIVAAGVCSRSYTTTYSHTVTTDPPNSPDPAHVKTVVDTASFNGSTWKVTFDRDAKTSTVESPLGRKTIVKYAQTTAPGPFLGAAPWQVESVETAPVAKVTYAYDALGRVTSAKQCADPAIPSTCREVKYGYKTSGVAKGSLDWVDDPLGKRTSFVRDAAFRATETTLPGARTIGMRFDTAANEVALKTPRHAGTTKEHRFLYDLAGRPLEYQPPAVTGAPNTTYGFNLDDQPTSVNDGVATGFTYDYPSGYPSGQLHSMSHPGGTTVATWRPDDRLERLTSVLGDTIEPIYDGALTIGSTATWRVPGTGTALTARTSVQIDPVWLRPSHLLLNDGSPLALAYDGDGLVTGVGDLTLDRPTTGPTGRHDGRMTAATIGSLQTQYHYDAFGELKGEFDADGVPTLTGGWGMVTQWSGVDRLKHAYERDGAGRIKAIVEKVGTATHRRLEYQYDDAGRLWKVSEKIGTAPPTLLVEYEYDANGNRTKLTRGGTVLTGYVYDDQDRQSSFPIAGGTCTQQFTAGRVTRRICPGEDTTYTYDANGKLLKVERAGGPTVEYLVDALGRRIGRREGTGNWTFWAYAGGLAPVAELDHTGAVVSRFVYATRVNVPDYVIQGAKTYRLLTDHLGSVRLVVDTSNGAAAHTVTYDDGAFGAITSETTDAAYVGVYRPMPFGFAGGLHDRTTKLVRFGARDYDPLTGRWQAKDPIGFDGGLNLYGYADSEPVNATDPTGLATSADVYCANPANAAVCAMIPGGAAAGGAAGVAVASAEAPRVAEVGKAAFCAVRAAPAAQSLVVRAGDVARNLAGVVGRVATRINLAAGPSERFTPLRQTGHPVSAGWKHVLTQHFDRAVAWNRSIFTISPGELRSVLQGPQVVSSPVSPMGGGQFVRIVDVGATVGEVGLSSLKNGGGPTTVLQVITDPAGNLITAYPL